MPYCEECSRYFAPSALRTDGTCPTCGRPVGDVEQRASEVVAEEGTPWHFKLLVAALIGYLGWRFVDIFV